MGKCPGGNRRRIRWANALAGLGCGTGPLLELHRAAARAAEKHLDVRAVHSLCRKWAAAQVTGPHGGRHGRGAACTPSRFLSSVSRPGRGPRSHHDGAGPCRAAECQDAGLPIHRRLRRRPEWRNHRRHQQLVTLQTVQRPPWCWLHGSGCHSGAAARQEAECHLRHHSLSP